MKKAAIGKLPAAPATMPADDQRSLDQLLNFIQDGPAGRCLQRNMQSCYACFGIDLAESGQVSDRGS